MEGPTSMGSATHHPPSICFSLRQFNNQEESPCRGQALFQTTVVMSHDPIVLHLVAGAAAMNTWWARKQTERI